MHTLADQLLPQLLMEQFDTCLYKIIGTSGICMKKFAYEKIFFFTKWQLCELRHFSCMFLIGVMLVLRADQLLPQLLMDF